MHRHSIGRDRSSRRASEIKRGSLVRGPWQTSCSAQRREILRFSAFVHLFPKRGRQGMRRLSAVLLGLFVVSSLALGQGVQTGTLIGTTWLTEGTTVLPGVTVTVESPALQGKRTQASGPNGD